MTIASARGTVERGLHWVAAIVRELSRIPFYNNEAERLMRAMRNGRRVPRDTAGTVRVFRRVSNRLGRNRAAALSLWALVLVFVALP